MGADRNSPQEMIKERDVGLGNFIDNEKIAPEGIFWDPA
jgi:hypothetical protein